MIWACHWNSLVVVLGVSGSVSFHAAAADTAASRHCRSLQAWNRLYAWCHIYCSRRKVFGYHCQIYIGYGVPSSGATFWVQWVDIPCLTSAIKVTVPSVICGGSYWAGRAVARLLFEPCGPLLSLAHTLLMAGSPYKTQL